MKKLTVVASVAIAAAALTSCGNSTPKADLKNDVDSMSYAIGMAQTQGLKDYLVGRMGVDTTYIDEFVRGLNEGANAGDDKKKAAYYAGIQIGQQIANQMVKGINYEAFGDDSTQTISLKNFMAGFVSGTTGKKGLMTPEQAMKVANEKMKAIKTQTMEKRYGDNKKKGEEFLAENAKKEGVKTLPGGVQYKVIKEGNGKKPKATDKVKCHYEGFLIDGTVFDSSVQRGEPAVFGLQQVIAGWTEGLQLMQEGAKYRFFIPYLLAYGEGGAGAAIPPYAALIFDVELIEVI